MSERGRNRGWSGRVKRAAKRLLQRRGFDVVRYPLPYSLDQHLAMLLDQLDVDLVLDVGAHHGEYGQRLREFGYRGHIISFEPVRASYECLVAAAAGDDRWTTVRSALGDEPGTAKIHANPPERSVFDSLLSLSDLAYELMATHDEPRQQEVTVATLDGVLADVLPTSELRRHRPFLKLDTQGYDMRVLDGARRTLPLLRGMQIELALRHLYQGAPSYRQVLERLEGAGFAVTGLFPVARDRELRLIEMDCVLRRTDDGRSS